uniref:TIL domain-containing protein n=1 Tax=Romanomermis culicivorax TaxID=13658 RepID=A0A915HP77_ROMCU
MNSDVKTSGKYSKGAKHFPRHFYSADLTCPPGKVLNPCGDLCQVTCKDVTTNKLPKVCPQICNPPACVCPDGQALIRGQCVAYGHCWRLPSGEDQASKKLECPPGKVLDPCGDLCEVTCDDVTTNNIPKSCPKICLEPACVCHNGTAQHHRSSTCVPYGNCWRIPADTPHSGAHHVQRESKQTLEKSPLEKRISSSSSSESVQELATPGTPLKQMPLKICGPNEEYSPCGRRCERSCLTLYVLNPFCDKGPCFGDCTCKDGFVRDEQHACVPDTQCPNFKETLILPARIPGELKSEEESEEDQNKEKNQEQNAIHIRHRCGRNMEYQECGYPCERTCVDVVEHRSPPIACITLCKPPGCYCKSGFVRFHNGQRCV